VTSVRAVTICSTFTVPPSKEQQAADHETPTPLDHPAHGGEKEDAADGEKQGARQIGYGGGELKDPTACVAALLSPIAPDLGHVMAGDYEIEQQTEEKDSSPQIRIGFIARKEQHAAEYEHLAADLVEHGVDALPLEMVAQPRAGAGATVQPGPVDEEMRHGGTNPQE